MNDLEQTDGHKANSHSSHSRSFILQSLCQPTRVSIPLYNIAGLISEDSGEVATQMIKNCSRRAPHSHLTPTPRGTPANIPISLIFLETSIIGLHLLQVVWVYLYSHLCSGLYKTHLCCEKVHFGRSRSFRVVQGR